MSNYYKRYLILNCKRWCNNSKMHIYLLKLHNNYSLVHRYCKGHRALVLLLLFHIFHQLMMFPGCSYVMSQLIPLGRRNTRYKNPQLVAQHCFVVSLGSTFRVFDLAWSICRAAKTFVAGCRKLLWESRARVCFERQILPLLLVFRQTHNLPRNKHRHRDSTPSKSTNHRAAFLQPATSVVLVW